ncbi:MAG: hypothetical protein HYZ14_05980 [Bacteroidetes bacterium]|nr:hypothetical protein [Bacteroidota bacterium]
MKKFILFSLALSALISCREDKKIPVCELHPDQCREVSEPKDYFLFGVGSYWVYEEENSGMIDSVYVTESYTGPDCYGFDVVMHSDYDSYDYHFWSILAAGGCPSCGLIEMDRHCVIIKKSKGKPGDFVSESYCFFTYAGVGDWMYSYGLQYNYNNVLKVDNIYPTILVGVKDFESVIKMSEEHTASEEAQPTFHYYSKGIGLVRKELLDSNQIWNLINYHIEN